MNHYSELLQYFKTLGEADVFVNTITQGDFDRLDLDKSNLFPLLHINVTGGNFTNGQTLVLNVQIGCFAIRDINKEIIEDKFWKQDNEVDNLNETLAVLNRIWTNSYKDFPELNITASENPSLEIFTLDRTNLLDGWTLSFDVELPNTTLSLCQ